MRTFFGLAQLGVPFVFNASVSVPVRYIESSDDGAPWQAQRHTSAVESRLPIRMAEPQSTSCTSP